MTSPRIRSTRNAPRPESIGPADTAAVVVPNAANTANGTRETILVADDRVHTDVSLITPLQAEKILREAGYDYQRKVREWHVREYADYMRRGEWKPNTVLTFNEVRDDATGKDVLFLIDGQHRLRAVIESGQSQQFVVLVERVESLDAVAANYTKYDAGVNRTVNERISTLVTEADTRLNATDMRRVLPAIRLIQARFLDRHEDNSEGRSAIEIARSFGEWQGAAEKLADTIGHYNAGGVPMVFKGLMNQRIHCAPCLAVALVTVRYQPDKALEFWKTVHANDGLRVGTPEHALAQFLLSTRVSRVGAKRYSRYVAAAWNRYFRGQGLLQLKVYNETAPIEIAGTPFKG